MKGDGGNARAAGSAAHAPSSCCFRPQAGVRHRAGGPLLTTAYGRHSDCLDVAVRAQRLAIEFAQRRSARMRALIRDIRDKDTSEAASAAHVPALPRKTGGHTRGRHAPMGAQAEPQARRLPRWPGPERAHPDVREPRQPPRSPVPERGGTDPRADDGRRGSPPLALGPKDDRELSYQDPPRRSARSEGTVPGRAA